MRPLVAEIRLAHLRHNYRVLKEMHGQNLLAVVKADAYGHGAVQCAKALDDMADGFAVAFLEEAVTLRENGIKSPILLLEGVFEPHEYALVEQYDLWTVIHQQTQLEDCLAHDWKQPATVWLKMDSGMHRAGFFPHNYAAAYHALQQSPKIGKIVKMTHFACADDAERGMTEMQIDTFDTACEGLGGDSSLANSAAILAYPEARREWGRAGLALYGVSPFTAGAGCFEADLKPVMRVASQVFAERVLQPHEPIGYGASFYTKRSTRVGLVACGYADGYPRNAPTDTPVFINGMRSRLIGRVSMDMLTVDLSHVPADSAYEVELFGDCVSINELAQSAGHIPYEILCHIKRMRRVYQA